ncbi:DUF882 domain-containing protein [Paraferrimonas haliotis]|nr:DUF882 domain-containing protein [Paraferrimonas haliotis]
MPKAFALGSNEIANHAPKTLSMYNRHTNEHLTSVFEFEGQWVAEGINKFNNLLRDHRQHIAGHMDPNLFNLIWQLQNRLGNHDEIHIISGYRSPKTNAMLAARSSKVAKKSYHMKGMAIDLAMPNVPLKEVRDAAIELKLGGVGYYERHGFVHVDTGPVRRW